MPYIFLACSASIFFFSLSASGFSASAIGVSSVIQKTNELRVQKGLLPLEKNAKLAKAAEAKAEDMYEKQYFAHQSPTGATPWDWMDQNHYNFAYAGENLAINFQDTQKLIDAWLASPAHKDNLLNSRFREIGVSVKTIKFEGKTYTLVVQMFGEPDNLTLR